jgi:hemolysin III
MPTGRAARVDARPETRPLLRGVSHQWGAVAFGVLGVVLVAITPGSTRVAVAVYAVCLTAMLTISAVYHRVPWGEVGRERMRKADHTGIFLAIAGTYTPIALAGIDGWSRFALLVPVWVLAGIGIALEWAPFRPPRGYATAVYVTLGWLAVFGLPEIWSQIGPLGFWLLFAGGVLYTLGAFVHAFRWPDPWPRVFGYHEIWHVFVLAAAALQFACIAFVVL